MNEKEKIEADIQCNNPVFFRDMTPDQVRRFKKKRAFRVVILIFVMLIPILYLVYRKNQESITSYLTALGETVLDFGMWLFSGSVIAAIGTVAAYFILKKVFEMLLMWDAHQKLSDENVLPLAFDIVELLVVVACYVRSIVLLVKG